MKLLCTGDVHLGQGADLARQPGDRLHDQINVLEQIAQTACDRQVDGILVAGDVFEGPGVPPEQLDAFARFVGACHATGIPILAVVGNGKHDAAVRATHGLAIFDHIAGIEVHSRPGWVEFAGCAVATLPWVSPARLIARYGPTVSRDEVNHQTGELLVQVARDLADTIRAMPLSSRIPSILLGHWACSGSALPNGLPVDQLREPVIPFGDLEQLGFDAIVMGHIHRPQALGESRDRHVLFDNGTETGPTHGSASSFYVGSPLPLNFGETQTAHGVWLIDPDGHTADGRMPSEFVPIPSRPLVTVDWKPGEQTLDEALSGDLEGAIVRLRYTATVAEQRRIDVAAVRADLVAAGAVCVRVVPEIVREQRARVQGLDEQVGELEALEQWMLAEGIVGVDEPVELAEPTRVLAEAVRAKARGYLDAAAA